MFYSNALSVRRILLEIKKKARSMGLLRRRNRWPGEVLVPKQDPTKETVLGKKKRVPTGGV